MPMYKENIQTILCTSTSSYFKMYLRIKWASLIAQFGKESACSAGDPSSIPGSGRSAGEGTHSSILGLPCGSAGKESACMWETWF